MPGENEGKATTTCVVEEVTRNTPVITYNMLGSVGRRILFGGQIDSHR
jgi:hypothetical protein